MLEIFGDTSVSRLDVFLLKMKNCTGGKEEKEILL